MGTVLYKQLDESNNKKHTHKCSDTDGGSFALTRACSFLQKGAQSTKGIFAEVSQQDRFPSSFPATRILIPAESRCSLHSEQLLTLRTQHLNAFKPTVYWSVCVFTHTRLDSRPRFHHSQTKLHLSDLHTLQKSDTGIISFHEH